jgi:carboxymethylenebutenolidase
MTVQNSNLTIEHDGSSMPAYVARPDVGSGPHPAVVVFQEIFGVNAEVKRICDLIASAGYVALAPNYYHRTHPDLNEPYTAEGLERGFAAAAQVSRDSLRKDAAAALDWLKQQEFVKPGKVAAWGFCFGGTVAFIAATLPGFAGAISFYGTSIAAAMPNGEPEALALAGEVACPVLLVFGGADDYVSPEQIDRIRRTLDEAGKDFEIQIYPTAGHAFFRGSTEHLGTSNHSEVVADAWNLVQAFFRRVFR